MRKSAVAVVVILGLAALGIAVFLARTDTSDPAPDRASRPFAGKRLEVFVGSASQPPTEEVVRRFEELTGARVDAQYGGSGAMLSQIKLAGRGDVYFPGSSDYLELAKREGIVDGATEVIVTYLIPAINTPKGNPANVRSLVDLARPGVRLGIARPDAVCVGLYAVEVLEHAGVADDVRPNIATHAESCAKTAQIVATGQVDAVLGWRVFTYWDPERIETVLLPRNEVPRIGYIPAAICRSSREPELARAFLAFLTSAEGQAIYRKWHYLTTEAEAREFALSDTPIGGEWPLPATWR